MRHRADDHAPECADDLLNRADDAVVVGTWVWHGGAGDHVLDDGAADLLLGDASLAQTPVNLDAALDRVHAEDRCAVFRRIRQAENEGGPIVLTYRVETDEGVRWILDHGRIYAATDAAPAHGHGILIDVTHRMCAGGEASETDRAPLSPLDRAARHAIAARRAIDADGTPVLRQMVDLLMWEIGRAIARRIDRARGRLN
ncbi:PAS domain-containing protein [Methylobacterium oxalidis]|uniref:PAS fold-3 domain-containing protein n=1 Tax=Methylobacterium oxalidis TaxID=944322 RepID=A0A512J5T9_9HYPH|nr:PAS domain-containing protein [Methylobacterium oxalidis]GEP05219.1 hypothetical protein MOX02_32570 [Methylobacterium oxalidis]GJE34219.1 hypothetical protein LDDCCGHA_4426 [Methylobacterium oxalidis]GLS66363.1 hypothetical protein GCM10007888_47460 [Methylobacterium oxalidis]